MFSGYKTRGMSLPNGKNNVYFCAHTDDLDKYLEPLSKEILDILDCVIWYSDSDVARNEAFFENLYDINLVVLPVTTNLLYTENDVIDKEIAYFQEHNIPILPFLMENNLAEKFNQMYDNIQCLDRVTIDPTSISYKEKLTSRLLGYICDEKTTEQIRNAFDAYVFLSYRKKDRKHANKLMELVHSNPLFYDIAIWYDEFLVAGENFDDAIQFALKKSDLFLMVVTPSIIEKTIDKDFNENDNYIVAHEYPMAKKENKPIIPAQLLETDKNVLDACFENLPDCVDAYDEKSLSSAFKKALKNLAIKETDASLEHKFFIGLAYLYGIDVEKNEERAVSLIESSADGGLSVAMDKLIDIYCDKSRVSYDPKKAEKYLEIYYSLLVNDVEKHEELLELSEKVAELSEILNADIVLKISKKAIDVAKALEIDSKNPKRFANILKNIGDAYYKKMINVLCEPNVGNKPVVLMRMYKENRLSTLFDTTDAYTKLEEYSRQFAQLGEMSDIAALSKVKALYTYGTAENYDFVYTAEKICSGYLDKAHNKILFFDFLYMLSQRHYDYQKEIHGPAIFDYTDPLQDEAFGFFKDPCYEGFDHNKYMHNIKEALKRLCDETDLISEDTLVAKRNKYNTYYSAALFFKKSKDFEKALEYCDKSLELIKQIYDYTREEQDRYSLCRTHFRYAYTLLSVDEEDLEKNRFEYQVDTCFEIAADFYDKYNYNNSEIADFYNFLCSFCTSAYKLLKDYDKMNYYSEQKERSQKYLFSELGILTSAFGNIDLQPESKIDINALLAEYGDLFGNK